MADKLGEVKLRSKFGGVWRRLEAMISVMRTNENPVVSAELTRRRFMVGALGALGATLGTAASGPLAAIAQTGAARGSARRVDFHHHFVPPRHLEAILAQRESGRTPPWSTAMSIDEMDKNGIATSIASLVQPGVWLGGTENSRRLARDCNEYGAKMVADHPGRFGFFAAIPLPDTQGSLREIEYAMDTLKADGIGLMTSFEDKYLGDPAFAPVYEELNRRQAIVYVHPTQPKCCTGLVPGVTVSTIEYATDSSRTIASLMFSGTAAKFTNIRFIFSHGGGTVPFLLGRFERLAIERKDPWLKDGAAPQLKKFYYEIAQANHPGALSALLELVPLSNVLFGSDYPLRPASEAVEGLTKYSKFNDAQRRTINRENAERLVPKLKA
jgi:predicted TIM-barrel fold metal-dependent hydrolase